MDGAKHVDALRLFIGGLTQEKNLTYNVLKTLLLASYWGYYMILKTSMLLKHYGEAITLFLL